MEFKGTKGKWVKRDNAVVTDAKLIADCSWVSQDDKYNALLISKAPEMLEFIKKLVDGKYLDYHEEEAKQLIKSATEITE